MELCQRKNGCVAFTERSMKSHERVTKSASMSSMLTVAGGVQAGMWRQRAGIGDLLLADVAPARILRRVVDVGRDAVDDVARAEPREELLAFRVLRVVGYRDNPNSDGCSVCSGLARVNTRHKRDRHLSEVHRRPKRSGSTSSVFLRDPQFTDADRRCCGSQTRSVSISAVSAAGC